MTQPFGPIFREDGLVEFRLFAPGCSKVGLQIEGKDAIPMERETDGVFATAATAQAGDRYGFVLANGSVRPDPTSRFQPDGVHGLSELVDLGTADSASEWKGVSTAELILYELHLGTFSETGNYSGAIARLPELVELGITGIELMPLAQSAGDWNWGYDGVNLFAPRQSYGKPEELLKFIETAHSLGLAVILDVVYNHFGPEGNYLGEFGGYTSKKHSTPWGDAPNYDGEHREGLRAWILENARYWVEDYGFDGLRLDATHYMLDSSTPHIVTEMGELFHDLNARLGREIHLIAESNVYDSELLQPLAEKGHGFDALWCDDFQHAVFGAIQPDDQMTSRNYRSGHDLELWLRRGYIFHGTVLDKPIRHLIEEYPDPIAREPLISSIQHHDFIGNHPSGLRLNQITDAETQRAAATLMMLSPSIPMLFMGEEFACKSPFYFFVDFQDPRLRKAVERGRKAEHPQHDWSKVESPTSPTALEKSKIGPASDGDQDTLDWYRQLIRLRKEWRAEGFLDTARMTARWDAEKRIASITYSKEGEERFVFVRLVPPQFSCPPTNISVEGEIQLSDLDAVNLVVAGKGNVVL